MFVIFSLMTSVKILSPIVFISFFRKIGGGRGFDPVHLLLFIFNFIACLREVVDSTSTFSFFFYKGGLAQLVERSLCMFFYIFSNQTIKIL